jgi:hypothetical protein
MPSVSQVAEAIVLAVACARALSPSPLFSALCGTIASFDAPTPVFLSNKELADRIHEKAYKLLKGIDPDRMKIINKLPNLSKPYSSSKVKVVTRFPARGNTECTKPRTQVTNMPENYFQLQPY